MKMITEKHLKSFLKLAGKSLRGEWLIVGGTVLPLLGVPHRHTVDIDIVPFFDATMDDTLKLMSIAEEIGLSIDTINLAATFFVRQIPDWKKRCLEVHKGRHCQIFVPNLNLFLELKLNRLTESDFDDCLQYIRHFEAEAKAQARICLKIIAKKLTSLQGNKLDRLQRLKLEFESLQKRPLR
jgi:hypothetical protein